MKNMSQQCQFWTHVSKFHFLAVVNTRDDSLALGYDVVVHDVVRQKAEGYKTTPITVTYGIGCNKTKRENRMLWYGQTIYTKTYLHSSGTVYSPPAGYMRRSGQEKTNIGTLMPSALGRLTYIGQSTFLAIIYVWDGSFSLRYDVIIINVV